MADAQFSPGSLVRARGREWIVLTGSEVQTLKLRPISGSEEDQVVIHVPLEAEPVVPARFPAPSASQRGGQDSALLLRDALLLSLRRGAGPFRSFGQIAVEPRAYQLVPLLMALKQDPVRLLIGDDVGIGKTIEAALIARELLDRGEVERFTVLCPPHLVDQWTSELDLHFNLRAEAVTATSARRLESNVPGDSIFKAYPYTVVSLDYIKSQNRRDEFLRACPELVIVDEAHTCAATGAGRHQRYELLKGLSESPARHLVMLTATPHSGDEAAFYRLLGLLDPRFESLAGGEGAERAKLREDLSLCFVQRRRPDISEWREGDLFPRRETKELTYRLTGEWERFFEAVLDYCAGLVEAAGEDERRRRLNFWGTLALMRCVASSPAAGAQALRTRAGLESEVEDEEVLADRLFDGTSDALTEDDVEPPAVADGALAKLITQAEALAGKGGDPKLTLLTDHLEELIRDGFNPVVFCRYIATAHYLGDWLKNRFKGIAVAVVTGELAAEERKVVIEGLGEADGQRLLIATDCLSEGINLQDHFDAVVHYDLSWNPTRHEQREGRVDRFGQQAKVVRTTIIYGANNPVDGAVLEVILRKAKKIREELGVPVPLPDEGHALTQALMKAVLLHHRQDPRQRVLDFGASAESKAIEQTWRDAAEKAKANRTVFAQRRLKPDEVVPEWKKTLEAMGGREDVKRFTGRALARLGAGLEEVRRNAFKAPLASLPEDVRERLEAEDLTGTVRISFGYPPAAGCRSIQRSHPLVSVLAETLLERSLAEAAPAGDVSERDPAVLGRVGCWVSGGVSERTTLVLLRARHQLTSAVGPRTTTLVVEEAAAIGWRGVREPKLMEGLDALALLVPDALADPPKKVAERVVAEALELAISRAADLEAFAIRRAEALLNDHRRVRTAAEAKGKYAVRALVPPDVIGVFVLLPKVS